MSSKLLPHATERLPDWSAAWRRAGKFVLLLDFDGTLAPIVPRPEDAALLPATRDALDRLKALPRLDMAVVSGRGMADARERVGLQEIAYAGNHGMEIEGPDVRRIHEEAAAARPHLAAVVERLRRELADVDGAFVEDKHLTLSIHYRRVARERVGIVREAVFAAVEPQDDLVITEGKEILEVRPAVDWDKGRAVEFLLRQLAPPPGTPVIYIGDDRTDEDAFRVLVGAAGIAGEGVIVGHPPPTDTRATSYLHDPEEVGRLLHALADSAV